eukprot:scaffold255667_cov18-Tisochrysis_lutea.AAC.2
MEMVALTQQEESEYGHTGIPCPSEKFRSSICCGRSVHVSAAAGADKPGAEANPTCWKQQLAVMSPHFVH